MNTPYDHKVPEEQKKPKKFGAYPSVPIVIGVSLLLTVLYSYLTVEYENFSVVFMSTFLPRIILGVILTIVGIRRVIKNKGLI